jgi:hypothetical protein
LSLDKDTFYINDLDSKNGLWVDVYEEYWNSEGKTELKQILELRVFGKVWIIKVGSAFLNI